MKANRIVWAKRLLFLPPVAIGIALLVTQLGEPEPPEHAPPAEIARQVRIMTVEPTAFVPRAVGYGLVQPGSVWNAVAQVSGNVVERNPDLETGELLDAGTPILRIDPVDYELAVAQLEARLASARAELAELDVREDNTRTSLEIERRAVALSENDLARKRTLLARGNASQSTVDEAERQFLTQRQQVQELENQIALIPAQRQVLEASIALTEAQLKDAALDLARTAIEVPFESRIAEVMVEENQYVNVGETLAVADSIDVAEITAQVPIEQMSRLVLSDIDLSQLTAAELGRIPDKMGLTAKVRLKTGTVTAEWPARVDRISPAVDPQTRTVGVVVSVDEPYRSAVPGRKPPLVKNMYVHVTLFGQPWPGSMVIPRVALHRTPDGPRVYVADAKNRLRIRAVELRAEQGDLVVLESGLEPGHRVVVTDLIPASDGMLLSPHEDLQLTKRLVADASRMTDPAPVQ